MTVTRTAKQEHHRQLKRARSLERFLGHVQTVELENALLRRGSMTIEELTVHVGRFPLAVIEQAYKNKGGVTSREAIVGMSVYQLWECLSARCAAAVVQLEFASGSDGLAGINTWFKGSFTHCNGLAHQMGAWARRRDQDLMDEMSELDDEG